MGEDDLGEGRAVDELLTFVGGRLAPDPRPDARPGRAGRTRLSTPMPLGYPS